MFKINKIIQRPNKKFIYVHVPKTGGISMCAIISITSFHLPIQYFKPSFSLQDILNPKNFINKSIRKIIYRNLFSFAFVRNPWDRVVSAFFYLNKGGLRNNKDERDKNLYLSKYKGNFKNFVKGELGNDKKRIFNQLHFKPQFYFVCDKNGKLNVDFIGRFENLQEDFNKLADILKLKKQKLHHKNKSNHNNYREYYDAETREIVAKAYKKDIELFNYEF